MLRGQVPHSDRLGASHTPRAHLSAGAPSRAFVQPGARQCPPVACAPESRRAVKAAMRMTSRLTDRSGAAGRQIYRSFSHRNFNEFPFPPFPEDIAGVSGHRPGLRWSYAAPDGNHRGVSGAKVRGPTSTSRIAGGCSPSSPSSAGGSMQTQEGAGGVSPLWHLEPPGSPCWWSEGLWALAWLVGFELCRELRAWRRHQCCGGRYSGRACSEAAAAGLGVCLRDLLLHLSSWFSPSFAGQGRCGAKDQAA